MKTFVCSWILLGVATVGAFANPGTKKDRKAKPQATLQKQLTDQLTYPDALSKATGNGVVVIQFRLADDNKVITPVVHTADRQLNDELIRQLMNVRLTPPESANPADLHTARLRFVANE